MEKLEELLDSIRNGALKEHIYPNVELKSSWEQKYGEKLSGLANQIEYDVCWMVVGVANDGRLVGIDEERIIKEEEKLSQHINSNLDPIQAAHGVKACEVNGSWVLVIKIGNPGAVVRWNHVAYKKAGTTILAMRPEEEMEFTIRLPGLLDYSRQLWEGSIDSDLVESFIVRLRKKRKEFLRSGAEGASSAEDILRGIRIKNTNTSRILFGDFQYRVVFYGRDDTPVSNTAMKGLYGLLQDKFIRSIQKWPKRPGASSSASPFPENALKESLANAVAHAAYFEGDGEVIVEVFQDRIMISNLCLPDIGYFANKWFSRSHKTVNGVLMETLRLAGIVDELGRGKNLIFADSIRNGKRPPYVSIERAGRFSRWRLCLYGGQASNIQLRLSKRIREMYPSEQKALIALALIYWSKQPVSQIRHYIDSESVPLFAEVLQDSYGPIFFYEKEDRIVLQRWVRILLEEGKDSKTFTHAEEEEFYRFSYEMQSRYNNFIITPKELRKLAHMGDTKSEIVLSSTLLKKWVSEEKVDRMRKGVYKFRDMTPRAVQLSKLLELLQEKSI